MSDRLIHESLTMIIIISSTKVSKNRITISVKSTNHKITGVEGKEDGETNLFNGIKD